MMIGEVLELGVHGLRRGVMVRVPCVGNKYMTHTESNGEVNVTN